MRKISLYAVKLFSLAAVLFLTDSSVYSQGTGVPDPGFGNNGQVLNKISTNRNDISQSIAVTPDGKIVVSGNSFNSIGYSNNGIVRYKDNGKPDKSFNGTGTVIIKNTFANIVLAQPDNKIVLGGSAAVGSTTVFDVWRVNSDGTIDSTFGIAGNKKIGFNNGNVICYAMTMQPDGKILIGGSTDINGGYSNLVLVRLNSNGSLDNSFGTGGKFSQTLSYRSLSCQKILLLPNGKIIAAGQYDTIINFEFFHHYMYALRLTSNGTIDSEFGNNGWARYGNATNDYCYSAALLPDSRIVLAGFSEVGTSRPASVLCLNKRGIIDKSFGTSGWQYIIFSGGFAIANATCVQTNGKIILAGSNTSAGGIQSVFLARLNPDGGLDPLFAHNGKDTFFTSLSGVGCNDAVLQTDEKILITGYRGPSPYNYLTARFLNDQQITAANSVTNTVGGTATVEVNIVPNPIAGNLVRLRFNLTTEETLTIGIYDLNNKSIIAPFTVQKQRGLSEQSITLPAYVGNGIYSCIILANKKITTLKFIVNK